MSFDVNKVRADFPQLTQKIRGKQLVYLDSAATALKPWPVIERIGHFNSYEVANVHRGAHYLADQATNYFEQTREKVRKFINAKETAEIIFTKGTTESVNLVATSWARTNLRAGDEVLITEMEHHANIVPWQLVCEEAGAFLKVAPISDLGELKMDELEKLITEKTRIVAVTHASNHLGTINPIQKITELAHKQGALVFVDGAQMVAYRAVDVQALNADFYAFSGHKIFGPFGIGILYGKRELLEKMPPYQSGGSMISSVTFKLSTFNELPFKFEAGTPNIEAAIALGAALDYVGRFGFSELEKHESEILSYATESLSEIGQLTILGLAANKVPIVSFVIKGFHHSDIAQILDQEAIAVRAGHHCTQPLLRRLLVPGTVRASFSIFNTRADVDRLVTAVKKAKELLL